MGVKCLGSEPSAHGGFRACSLETHNGNISWERMFKRVGHCLLLVAPGETIEKKREGRKISAKRDKVR